MVIAFTGHRDCKTRSAELADLRDEYPDATWKHGGARGFDRQVGRCAGAWLIEQIVIRPNWDKYGRAAAMIRNKDIISGADILVACWDGREEGGTWGTIQLAMTAGLEIRYVTAISQPGKDRSDAAAGG